MRSCQLCSYSRISQHFLEPTGSLLCSQEPSTGLYAESDQSSLYHPFLSVLSILMLSIDLCRGLPSGLLSHLNPICIPTPIRAAYLAHVILLDLIILIILGKEYKL
jgi:hypothetical protein